MLASAMRHRFDEERATVADRHSALVWLAFKESADRSGARVRLHAEYVRVDAPRARSRWEVSAIDECS
jgi:hypothetical protein